MTSTCYFSSSSSFISCPSLALPCFAEMEDCNMLAANCIVISCCCQCLILQIIIFVLLKFPCKLIRKIKELVKKFRKRKKGSKGREALKRRVQDEFVELQEGLLEEIHGGNSCMEEVERVLEEFSQKGELAFGSFWGRKEGSRRSSTCSVQEFDFSVVQFELVEIDGSFTY